MTYCPVCNQKPSRVINTFTSSQVANSCVLENADVVAYTKLKNHLETLWQGNEARVVECTNCGLYFADPFIAGDEVFYELSSFDTPYPKDKWEFSQTLKKLNRSAKDASILEIGAGKGYFLEKLVKIDYRPNNITALEYSSAGRAAIQEMGITCLAQDVRSVKFNNKFDVICLFQVLEHLDNYASLFETFNNITTPHSDLFISVPYGLRITKNERLGLLWDLPPNHISRWMPNSFQALAQRFNWRIISCELEPATRKQEMTYAFVNRYIRATYKHGSLANRIYVAASKIKNRKYSQLAKLAGAGLTPSTWLTALATLKAAPMGHTLMVHMQRN